MSELEDKEIKRKLEGDLVEESPKKKTKRSLFHEEITSPKMKIKNQIKVLQDEEEKLNAQKTLPTKEKIIDDLHWSLEQWQEKKVNITPRTMKLLNLAGILNEKDLLETPLTSLQEIVTVKEGKENSRKEKETQVMKLIKHVKTLKHLNQLVLERTEKENKIRKEIRDRERELLEEEKYHTKL
jgi:hypothetical protein